MLAPRPVDRPEDIGRYTQPVSKSLVKFIKFCSLPSLFITYCYHAFINKYEIHSCTASGRARNVIVAKASVLTSNYFKAMKHENTLSETLKYTRSHDKNCQIK